MFYVYVLRNQANHKIYIGQTQDLEKRLLRHNQQLPTKKSSFTTINNGLWQYVYIEEYATRSEAIKRERQLKSAQGRKFIHMRISSSAV